MASKPECEIRVAGAAQIRGGTAELRDVWEATSFALERLQSAEECVDAEQQGLKSRKAPQWALPFKPTFTPQDKLAATDKVRIATETADVQFQESGNASFVASDDNFSCNIKILAKSLDI